jgi:clan AA aspartic protease (TIGR02281 family)
MFMITSTAAPADFDAEGRAAYVRGDYAAAERAFSTAIASSPGDSVLRYHRAASLTQLGRWEEAVAEYEQVLKLRPSDEVAAAARAALKNLKALTAQDQRRGEDSEGRVRLERWGGGWVAEVVINNAARGRFLVDTGASITAISRELADGLGIAPGRPPVMLKLQTMSGELKAPLVSIAVLKVGSVEAKDVSAVVHDVPGGLDGVLGNTFLDRYSVTFNTRQGLLTVRGK